MQQFISRRKLWQFGSQSIKQRRHCQSHFTFRPYLFWLTESNLCRSIALQKCYFCQLYASTDIFMQSENKINNADQFTYSHEVVNSACTAQDVLQNTDTLATSNSDELVMLIEHLCSIVVQKIQQFPWACVDNPSIVCVQSYRNKECRRMIYNFTDVPVFQELCGCLHKNVSFLSNAELIGVANSLIWLHVSPENQLLCDLLLQCIQRCRNFSVTELSAFSCVTNRLSRSGFHINALITQTFQNCDLSQAKLSNETYTQVAQLVSNVSYFFSPEFVTRIVSCFRDMLTLSDCNLAPSSSLQYLEALSRFATKPNHELATLLAAHLHKHLNSLTAWQMARVVIFLKQLNCFNHPIMEDIETRATQMLKGFTLTPVDVTSLATIMEYVGYPHDSLEILEQLLLTTLHDFDVILLKDLSKKQLLIRSHNSELKKKFTDVVTIQLPDLVNTPSCFLDVIFVLTRMQLLDQQLGVLTNVLLHLIQTGHYGSQQDHMVIIAQYFLQQSLFSQHIPSVVLDRLIAFLPQYSLKSLQRLNTSMSFLRSAETPLDVVRRIDFARSLLRRQTVAKLANGIETLNSLNATIKCLSKSYKTQIPIGKVAELYQTFISHLDVKSIKMTSDCIRDLKLYLPEVLEVLVEFSNQHADSLGLNEVASILHTLSLVNHLPQNIECLQDVFLHLCSKCNNQHEVVPIVLLGVSSLAMLDVYQEKLITTVFSIDYLKRLDQYCEDHPRTKQNVHNQLKDLNRCVVLNCPQLGIPWFHHALCQEECDIIIKPKQPNSASKLHLNLKNALLSQLGGEDYLQDQDLFSEYFHEIDFLCILNRQKIPLDVKKHKDDAQQTRVAIILLKQKNYCANEHRLTGPTASKLRELEILGYKLVAAVDLPYKGLKANVSKILYPKAGWRH